MASRQNELQLLEASRGPYRLNQVINQQSRVPSLAELSQCDGNTLLKSTFDLQESLIMLGKLQAMNNVSQAATRNLMEEIEIEIIRSELGQASKKYAVNRCNNRLHEDRQCSSSRCWRSRNGELKKVIRDSLCAQSVLSNSSDDEKASSCRSYASFASSRFDGSYEMERNRDSSSTSSQQSMTMRTPNLIARLMGLDEIPSEDIQTKEENSRLQGLMFTTEAPKTARKPIMLDQKLRPMRGTLFDIIERERLERSRRIQQVNESGGCSSDTSSSQLQEEESYIHEETRRITGLKATPCIKREKFREYYPSSENLKLKIGQSTKRVTDGYELVKEGEKNHLRSPQKNELKASQMHEGFEERQTLDIISKPKLKLVSKKIILGDAHELSKNIKRNTFRKLEKTKVELSQETKKTPSLYNIQNRTEVVKSAKKTNPSLPPKISEMSSEKPKHNKVKLVQLSDTKTARKTATVHDKRCSVFRNASGPVKHSGTSQTNRSSSTHPRRKQNEKNQAQKINTTKPVKKKDVTTLSSSCEKVLLISPSSEEGHNLKSSITGTMKKDQKVICEVMPKGSKVKQPCKLETTTVSGGINTAAKISEVEDFKGLLLKNRPFLMHAYELCTQAHQTPSDEKESLKEEVKDEKLYLACANELMARESYKTELSKHPMSTFAMKLSVHAYLDQLVGVISRGIRTLCNYSNVADDNVSNDSLYVRLRKDMECKEMMLSSMWDMAWWNGVSMEEAGQVVGQVEEAILFSLVEDTVMTLLH